MPSTNQAPPPSRRYSESTTDQCKHNTFREKLPHKPAATSSQRLPYGNLTAPIGGARQKQVGYVGARDQQHDTSHPHQQLQRKCVSVSKAAGHAGCG